MKNQSTRLKLFLVRLASLAMLVIAAHAQARVTCTVSSPGFATAYPMTGGALNITAASFTVTCTKTGAGTATVTYQVGVNNGANAVGTQNRASSGASRLNYDVYSDLGCTNQWQNTAVGNRIPNPAVSFPLARGTPDVRIFTFYGCVPAGLVVPAAGTYTDTVTMAFTGTVSTGTSTFTGGTFPVSITAPATCTITTPPGNITFNYTSFSSLLAASTTFATTCTNLLPYTMALDATGGSIVGVNYTLALSAPGGTGTGLLQTYTIDGSIAAGQAGTCAGPSCTGSQGRTLTITY